MTLPIAEWTETRSPAPGMYSYPFTLQIPAWLPASMFLAQPFEECMLKIRYFMTA
jgi:hypothetical protein